jgi:PII-like signaling protein
MKENGLKLTSYFGERDRAKDGFVGDALLEAYCARGLQASVMLRGFEGSGRRHQLHTDRLLTLSEDLPIVSVAVDKCERIESLLKMVIQIQRCGLITLERVWLLTEPIESVRLPEQLDEGTKLSIYVERRARVNAMPAYVAITTLLHRHGIVGATVLLGVDGTWSGQRRRARFFARNESVSMVIVAVDAGKRIAEVLPEVGTMLPSALITLERVRVCKRDGQVLAPPPKLPSHDEQGRAMWQKLMVYTSQTDTHGGHPIHMQIVRRLRDFDGAGVTCLRGIWGFHGDHAPHGERFFQIRRHVPVMTVVIDAPARIASAFSIIDELTNKDGLVTSETVSAMTATYEAE